ncbi:MAG: GTPase HflX [Deltaproteobacteria bacterium]|nr:GTPase HflX [Deltaproteobacteria bacterium]
MTVDRAVLVGAPLKTLKESIAQEHLEELTRLTDTAGGQVVAVVRQRIDAPHPRFYIGKGKVEELRESVAASDADLAIFDDELTPAQGKALEDQIGVRVLDRAELILDIFATRARTGEAKMQVELAQLQYLLPRLKRMWTHLSRIRGGVGLRGPGETQLESDRRLIGRRIAELRKKLEDVTQARAVQRQSREGKFRVALVGYTNAGKSSLLRALSDSDLFVEDRLFATLDSTTRSVDLGEGLEALVTDTVGFIRKLPHHLVASFRSTLEEAREADLLAHVIDAAYPGWEEQKSVVEDVLDDLDLGDRPQILVFNKIDRLTHEEEEALSRRVRSFDTTPAVFLSALRPDTFEPIRALFKARIRAGLRHLSVRIGAHDGQTLAMLYREGEVLNQSQHGDVLELEIRVPLSFAGRLLKQQGVELARDHELPA